MSKKKYRISAPSLVRKTAPIFPVDSLEQPVVYYSEIAWQKILRAIDKCTKEVGWLGTVEKIGKNYIISDIFVPEQTVHASETDIKADALADLAASLDDPEKLYYWGHSHVNMGVGPSNQDEEQASEYLEHLNVFIRGIYNKKGESKVDVYDVENGFVYQAVENVLYYKPLSEEAIEAFDKTLTENVKENRPVTYCSNYPSSTTNSSLANTNPFIKRKRSTSNA